jgi:hypothetical protein
MLLRRRLLLLAAPSEFLPVVETAVKGGNASAAALVVWTQRAWQVPARKRSVRQPALMLRRQTAWLQGEERMKFRCAVCATNWLCWGDRQAVAERASLFSATLVEQYGRTK